MATTTFIALLRAINVGGTGKLSMPELKSICEAAGCADVRTYINSGNVVFRSSKRASSLKTALETAVARAVGKPIGIALRTADELRAVLAANPFPKEPPNRTVAIFLDEPPPGDTLRTVTGKQDEKLKLGEREIYVAYGAGMGKSKLRIPAAKGGTARNINTITKLVKIADG